MQWALVVICGGSRAFGVGSRYLKDRIVVLLPPLFSSAGRYQQTDEAEGEPILFNSKTACLILYFFNCILVGFI